MNLQTTDLKLFFLINQGTANSWFDVIMPALTQQGYLLFLPYVVYVLWKGRSAVDVWGKTRLASALWAVAIALCAFPLADLIGNMIKHGVARIRPCNVLDGIRLLVGCTQSYSMPSNHAVNSFAGAVPVFYLTRGYVPLPWRCYPLGLAAAICFSRVYVGVHYPSDVIAGALLGSVTAILLIIIWSFIRVRKSPEQSREDKAIL